MKNALLVFLVLFAQVAAAQVLDRPVAVVRLTETANIGLTELNQQIATIQQQLGRELTAAEKQEILDAMINDRLLLQGARRDGVRVSQADVQNYLAAQRAQYSQAVGTQPTEQQFRAQVAQQTGMGWDEYVQQVTNELSKIQYVQQREASLFTQQGQVQESEIRAFYEENATSFTNPAMVRFEHIYVDLRGKNEQERQDARQLLDRIYRRIRSGSTTFDSVASEAADDATYSADDFGYLLRNDPRGVQLLGRSFVDEVFALDEGDVDGVLESSVAVHIVHVLDKRTPRILELDDPILPGQPVTVRQQIRNLIAQQKQQQVLGQAVQSVVEDLRSEAEVTVFDQNIPW